MAKCIVRNKSEQLLVLNRLNIIIKATQKDFSIDEIDAKNEDILELVKAGKIELIRKEVSEEPKRRGRKKKVVVETKASSKVKKKDKASDKKAIEEENKDAIVMEEGRAVKKPFKTLPEDVRFVKNQESKKSSSSPTKKGGEGAEQEYGPEFVPI